MYIEWDQQTYGYCFSNFDSIYFQWVLYFNSFSIMVIKSIGLMLKNIEVDLICE